MEQIQKEWLSLKSLEREYVDLSERGLRNFLKHETHPLPAKLVEGKYLVNRLDFDQWLRGFPGASEDLDQLVDDILEEIGGQNGKK